MTETFTFNNSEKCTLSIRLNADGFSFHVSDLLEDRETTEVCNIDDSISLTANLKLALARDSWAGRAFARVNVVVSSKRFTLIPLEVFDEQQQETVFYYNHPKRDGEVVLHSTLQRSGIVVVYGMDKSAYILLKERYPEARFMSLEAVLIEYLAVRSRMGNCCKLFAYVGQGSLGLFAYDKGRLLLSNVYDVRHADDVQYYILYCWKQLDFDCELDELHFAGDVPGLKQVQDAYKRYIRNVLVMPRANELDKQALGACV